MKICISIIISKLTLWKKDAYFIIKSWFRAHFCNYGRKIRIIFLINFKDIQYKLDVIDAVLDQKERYLLLDQDFIHEFTVWRG